MYNQNTPTQTPIPVPPPPPQNIQSAQPAVSPAPKFGRKKLGLIVLGALIVVLIVVGLLIKRNVGTVTHGKINPNPLVATVGDNKIYEHDIVIEAQKQYAANAITPDVMKTFLNTMIERLILDQEAKKNGINISDAEIDVASGNSKVELVRDKFKYELIKEKIMRSQVKSADAYMFGFWIPSYADQQQPIFAQQRLDGDKALSETQLRLSHNEKPIDIAKSIYAKYKSLKNIWSLNGYILDKPNDEVKLSTPRLYSFDKEALEALDDPEVYTAMQDIKDKEIRRVNRPNGSGGVVIQIVHRTTGEFSDYKSFLAQRESELVKRYREL